MHPTCDSEEVEVGISRGGGKSNFCPGDFGWYTDGGVSKISGKRRNIELSQVPELELCR